MQTTTPAINWKQISSLAALNAAVAISWIAYSNYQVRVLEKFQLMDLGFFLVAAQGAIMVLIPPLAGLVGDYMIRRNSNYFVVYTVGISVTAMVFMIVSFTLGNSYILPLRAAFPFMIVLWLISMNILHSPANSMVELFAPAQELPKVMALITVTTGIIMALEPIIIPIIDYLGAPLTFLTGGVLLIVTGYIFRRTTANIELKRKVNETSERSRFAVVILAGLLFGILMGLVNNDAFVWITNEKFSAYSTGLFGTRHFVSIILAVSALLAFPASSFAARRGLMFSLIVAFLTGVTGFMILWLPAFTFFNFTGCLLLGAGISLAAVSAFPLALNNLEPRHITFGTGIFFGCSELFTGILNLCFFS